MECWALVPVKARADGKSRLAPVLRAAERMALVRAMLAHVLSVLAATPGIDRLAIVSSERDDLPEDVVFVQERDRGLNIALSHAVVRLKTMGASQVVIVPGDLPLLETKDVEALLAGARDAGCALASDTKHEGTNAIALNLARMGDVPFRFLFGRGSFARHRRQAAVRGLGPRIVESAGLEFDVDDPHALALYQAGADTSGRMKWAS